MRSASRGTNSGVGSIVGLAAIIALIAWMGSWTGPNQPTVALDALWVLLTSGRWAALWLISALGYGWPLRRWLWHGSHDVATSGRWAAQIGLGVAALLTLDAALGAIGFLSAFHGLGAWLVIVAGLAMAGFQVVKGGLHRRIAGPPWMIWTAAPAIAVLLLASCSAPGWLWSTEFGGYDALSYHLQAPKEWLALGRIEPLQHNVYTYFPGYVEAAYFHLDVLIGDAVRASYACQLLHAGLALLTAFVLYVNGSRIGGSAMGVAAAVIFLGTPWVIVTGSLAYNEMAVALMLATGLFIAREPADHPAKTGAALGVLAAAACGAKLTALGMVALPLGLVALYRLPRRTWLPLACGGVAAGLVVLSPWIVRNALWAGNPIFPMGTRTFGLAHWTAEQAEIWRHAHASDAGLAARFEALWHQVLRFGLGPNPNPDEPWRPQWSIVPWLAAAGLAIGLPTRTLRREAAAIALVLGVQLAFWLACTHLKSRFMVPAAVPMALAAALGGAWVAAAVGRNTAWPRMTAVPVAALALACFCCVPMLLFWREGPIDGAHAPSAQVGAAELLTGDAIGAPARVTLARESPVVFLNHAMDPAARVLMIGEAAPLYYHDSGRFAYTTVWDRGPLSEAVRDAPLQPDRWCDALQRQGFTHVLVNSAMLQRWERAGWLDPMLTRERMTDFLTHCAGPAQPFPGSVALYELPPESNAQSPPPTAPPHTGPSAAGAMPRFSIPPAIEATGAPSPELERYFVQDLSDWRPVIASHSWGGVLAVDRDNYRYLNGSFSADPTRIPQGIIFGANRQNIIFEDVTLRGTGAGITVENQRVRNVTLRRVQLLNCRTPDRDYPDPADHLMRSRGYGAYLNGAENWRFEECVLHADREHSAQYALRVADGKNLTFIGGRMENYSGKSVAWLINIDGALFKRVLILGDYMRFGLRPEDSIGTAECKNVTLDGCTIRHEGIMRPLVVWPGTMNLVLRNLEITSEADSWIEIDARNTARIVWENIRFNGKQIAGYEGVRLMGRTVEQAIAAGIGPAASTP